MTHRTSRLVAFLTVIALAVIGLGGAANAASTDHKIYKGDFIGALSDTRGTGYWGFGPKGLIVRTDSNTSTDKVAEYYAPAQAEGLPLTASQEWKGSSPEAGKQIVFDADATTGNGNDYNVLVGEPVYGDNWWLTNGSSATAKAADPSGANDGGNGSAYFGTLAQWKAALPNARVLAYGFSLGSGVKGDGTLVAQTFGGTRYVFTEGSAPVAAPPAAAPVTVTPTFTAKKRGHGIVFHFTGARWTVKVNGTPRYSGSPSGEATKFRYNVPRPGHTRTVKVFLNDALVKTYKVK